MSSKVYQTEHHQPVHLSMESPRTTNSSITVNSTATATIANRGYNNGEAGKSSPSSGITQVNVIPSSSPLDPAKNRFRNNNGNVNVVTTTSEKDNFVQRPAASACSSSSNNSNHHSHRNNVHKDRRVSLETTTMINSPLDLDQVT